MLCQSLSETWFTGTKKITSYLGEAYDIMI